MYGVYLTRWYAVAFGLALLILLVSFKSTTRNYWLAVLSYTVLVVGTAVAIVFPIFFHASMANAFSPHSVSPIVYAIPILVLAAAAIPALALYPWWRLSTARRIAQIFFGIPISAAIVYTLVSVFGGPFILNQSGPLAGFASVFFLLLWLRVYTMRSETAGHSL